MRAKELKKRGFKFFKLLVFTSMKFIGDDREEEEEIMTRIVLE